MRPKATVNETQWEMFLLYSARQPFPPQLGRGQGFGKHCCLLGSRTTLSGTKPGPWQWNWGRQPNWVNCIDGDSSELHISSSPQMDELRISRKFPEGPTKTKGKGNNKTRFVFPCPQPPSRQAPLQAASSTTSSAPVADGGALQWHFPRVPRWRGRLGSAFCASWIRRCMG